MRVVHFGPDIRTVGGTQSVIRILCSCRIGAEDVKATSTWIGSNQVANAGLVARAARQIATADKRVVLHFHISNGGAWVREGALLRLAHARGLRTAVTLHGGDIEALVERHPRLVSSTLGRAAHVFCLTARAAGLVGKLLGSDRVTVLPNPVVVDLEAVSASETAPVALFAGRIAHAKGVDVLVEAWRQMLATGATGSCRVIGPPDDFMPPKLPRMSVEPAFPPSEVSALLRSVRLVVLPSRAEGMPMILGEAFAARRPFVATDVGAVHEMTPDPEMIVPVNDADALALAITRYLEDAELAGRAGDAGQQHIIRTRSPAVIDEMMRSVYAQM